MASIFDKVKHSVSNGELHKQWKAAKKTSETLKLPKKDFGTDLDCFESSCKTADSLLKQIIKTIEQLKQEKQQCALYASSALSTAELYKKVAEDSNESSIAATLENIKAKIVQQNEETKRIPVPIVPDVS